MRKWNCCCWNCYGWIAVTELLLMRWRKICDNFEKSCDEDLKEEVKRIDDEREVYSGSLYVKKSEGCEEE